MCEPHINMPMPPHSSSPSPSTPPPRSYSVPKSPEISTRYSPELVKRMQADTCYRCGKKGHWSWYCPVSSPNKKPFSRSLNHGSPLNPTSCGNGLCVVKTSNCAKNPGRKYYACLIKMGKPCRVFVQMQTPLYKYPECVCGAGVCGKVKDPLADKYYFVCPVGKAHGSCGYKVLEDEVLGIKSIVPTQQRKGTSRL